MRGVTEAFHFYAGVELFFKSVPFTLLQVYVLLVTRRFSRLSLASIAFTFADHAHYMVKASTRIECLGYGAEQTFFSLIISCAAKRVLALHVLCSTAGGTVPVAQQYQRALCALPLAFRRYVQLSAEHCRPAVRPRNLLVLHGAPGQPRPVLRDASCQVRAWRVLLSRCVPPIASPPIPSPPAATRSIAMRLCTAKPITVQSPT